jgi:hypothetical protein
MSIINLILKDWTDEVGSCASSFQHIILWENYGIETKLSFELGSFYDLEIVTQFCSQLMNALELHSLLVVLVDMIS